MINPHNAPLSVYTSVPGWESVAEQGLLLTLASGFVARADYTNNVHILEIGSQFGMSASLFCEAAKQNEYCVKIICIDIDENAPFMENLNVAMGIQNNFPSSKPHPKVHEITRSYGIENWKYPVVFPVYLDSKSVKWEHLAYQMSLPNFVDLLFIDGDHSYGGALADLQNFTPHVLVGGIVAIHDCACNTNKAPHPSHHDVYNAVQAWLQTDGHKNGFRFMFSVDSTMVFRRMNSGNS